MGRVTLVVVLTILPAAVGCAGGKSRPNDSPPLAAPAGPSSPGTRGTVPLPPAVSLERPADGDYQLAAKDLLMIQVLGQEELTRTVRVSEAGSVTLPLVGDVSVANLTIAAAEEKIAAGLRGRYLVNPRVTVRVSEYAGRQVSVMGAVSQPGAYALKGNATTVLNALTEAKGVRDSADRVAYVMRARARPGEPQPLLVDLDALLRSGDVRHNVIVEAGDTVFVPEANVYYVAGEVEKRGVYALRRDTTLSKALAEAGGVTKRAAKADIKIVRTLASGKKEEITGLDLDAVMAGDSTQDSPLQAHDMVVVPASGAKVAAYEILDFLRGLISIGVH